MVDERRGSGFGKDRLGPGPGDSVDGAHTDESPVVEDLVFGRPGRRLSGAGDGLPGNDQGVSVDPTFSMQDGTGDYPLDGDLPGVRSLDDGNPSGVLGSVRVDPVDDVGADDSRPLFELGPGETGTCGENDRDSHDSGPHRGESTEGIRPIFKALMSVVGLIVIGVMAFAIFEPVQVLPSKVEDR